MMTKVPQNASIIIDTDANFPSDDVQSLLLLLNCPSLHIIGVSATAGNTYTEEVVSNLDALLATIGKSHIPLARGVAFQDLPRSYGDANELKSRKVIPFIGSFQKSQSPRLTHATWEHMPSLRTLIAQSTSMIDLICLGPLTNVAHALAADSSIRARIRHIWVMGGNTTFNPAFPKMDFNVWFDPQSAQAVFDSGIPMTVFPYETCRQLRSNAQTLQSVIDKGGAGLARLFSADFQGMVAQHGPQLPLCDQLVALSIIEPEILCTTRRARIRVDQRRGDFLGSSICVDDKHSPINVVKGINPKIAIQTMLYAMDHLGTLGNTSDVETFLSSQIYRLDIENAPALTAF